ncbi:MAG: FIST C-terminal domain-containing protein [Chitinophagaceae bacterium]|nr:FIST C-terminal domain-containing protein [Chitinophagaceae bacterium]
MQAKSIQGHSLAEIQDAFAQNITNDFRPTLAIVFMSIKQDRTGICKSLEALGIQVFGVTTNGEFVDGIVSKEAIAVLLLDINKAYFNIYFGEFPEKNYRESAAAIATKALEQFSNPAFLVSGSHLETDAEQLLWGFEDVVGKQVNIFGSMAGDDLSFTNQFVFTNEKESSRGFVVLALDENKVTLKGRATCGWKPVGTPKTVTRSIGNHVFTVDDQPVLDLTAKFGGLDLLTEKSFSMEMSTLFPLQLQRETGDPVMRPGMLIDWTDRSFYCSGSVPQGSKVRFSLPPDFDVVDKVIKGCAELKATEMPEADAVIIFSCAGRLVALGPFIDDELSGIQKIWNAPMIGMFSNAELGRATGGNLEMHNLTACCVTLKEK